MDNFTPGMSEKLVQYIDGELNLAERESLEQQLASNQTLQREFDSLTATTSAVKLYGLQQKVAGIHNTMMAEIGPGVKQITPGRKIFRYSIGVAASFILLIGGYMAYNFYNLSSDKVFASRYQSYQLVIVRDGNTFETLTEKAYREKNYTEVIRIHDAGEDYTPKGEFLCGAAALELKASDKAIKCFKEVLDAVKKTGQPVLKDETEYYLSLSYIRNKNYDKALELMNKIQDDPNHLYNGKITKKILRQVRMLKWK